MKNVALVKAVGFSSFDTLTAFIDQSLVQNPKAKKAELAMTPEVILANVKANPHLITPGPGRSFMEKLKKYAACSSEYRSIGVSARIGANALAALANIRENCSFLATLRLASDERPKTMMLSAWSSKDVVHPCRTLSIRELGNVIKAIRKADDEINIVAGSYAHSGHGVSFNCFHCPEIARDGLLDEPTLQFRDEMLNCFNVFRGLVLDDLEGIQAHLDNVHSVHDESNMKRQVGTHKYLLPCRFCFEDNSPTASANMFTCCLVCY